MGRADLLIRVSGCGLGPHNLLWALRSYCQESMLYYKICGWEQLLSPNYRVQGPQPHPFPSLGLSCRSPLCHRRIQQTWITRTSSFTTTRWRRKLPALSPAPVIIRILPPGQWLHPRRYVTVERAPPSWGGPGAEVANSCQRLSRMKIRSYSSKLKIFH